MVPARACRKRSFEDVERDNQSAVVATDSKQQHLMAVAAQWRRAVEALTLPDAPSNGARKPAEISWSCFISEALSEGELLDPPSWMSQTPAASFVDMLGMLTALQTKTAQAADRAKRSHERAQERANKSKAYQTRKSGKAMEKLQLKLDDEQRAEVEAAAQQPGWAGCSFF